jgi:hypothetical protein
MGGERSADVIHRSGFYPKPPEHGFNLLKLQGPAKSGHNILWAGTPRPRGTWFADPGDILADAASIEALAGVAQRQSN